MSTRDEVAVLENVFDKVTAVIPESTSSFQSKANSIGSKTSADDILSNFDVESNSLASKSEPLAPKQYPRNDVLSTAIELTEGIHEVLINTNPVMETDNVDQAATEGPVSHPEPNIRSETGSVELAEEIMEAFANSKADLDPEQAVTADQASLQEELDNLEQLAAERVREIEGDLFSSSKQLTESDVNVASHEKDPVHDSNDSDKISANKTALLSDISSDSCDVLNKSDDLSMMQDESSASVHEDPDLRDSKSDIDARKEDESGAEKTKEELSQAKETQLDTDVRTECKGSELSSASLKNEGLTESESKVNKELLADLEDASEEENQTQDDVQKATDAQFRRLGEGESVNGSKVKSTNDSQGVLSDNSSKPVEAKMEETESKNEVKVEETDNKNQVKVEETENRNEVKVEETDNKNQVKVEETENRNEVKVEETDNRNEVKVEETDNRNDVKVGETESKSALKDMENYEPENDDLDDLEAFIVKTAANPELAICHSEPKKESSLQKYTLESSLLDDLTKTDENGSENTTVAEKEIASVSKPSDSEETVKTSNTIPETASKSTDDKPEQSAPVRRVGRPPKHSIPNGKQLPLKKRLSQGHIFGKEGDGGSAGAEVPVKRKRGRPPGTGRKQLELLRILEGKKKAHDGKRTEDDGKPGGPRTVSREAKKASTNKSVERREHLKRKAQSTAKRERSDTSESSEDEREERRRRKMLREKSNVPSTSKFSSKPGTSKENKLRRDRSNVSGVKKIRTFEDIEDASLSEIKKRLEKLTGLSVVEVKVSAEESLHKSGRKSNESAGLSSSNNNRESNFQPKRSPQQSKYIERLTYEKESGYKRDKENVRKLSHSQDRASGKNDREELDENFKTLRWKSLVPSSSVAVENISSTKRKEQADMSLYSSKRIRSENDKYEGFSKRERDSFHISRRNTANMERKLSSLSSEALINVRITFEMLLDYARDVILPSSLWGVQVSKEKSVVVFTRVSTELCDDKPVVDKALVFQDSLEPVALIMNKPVDLPIPPISTFEDVVFLIRNFHSVSFCEGTGVTQRPLSKYCFRYLDVTNPGGRCSRCLEERRKLLYACSRKLRERVGQLNGGKSKA